RLRVLEARDVVRFLERLGLEHQLVSPPSIPPLGGLSGIVPPDPPRGRIALAVPDHTRPLPLRDVLRVLEPLLNRATLIFATGTHSMTVEEAVRLLGPYAGRVSFKVHDCRGIHKYVGATSRGLQVEVDSTFVEADFRVTVGLVAPHPWAGFSGGSKVVLPGLSSQRTIVEHHVRWYEEGRPAVVEGNPFREEIDEAGRLAGVDWALNVVLDGDGRVVYAAAGEPQSSFRACVEVAERLYVRDVDGPFDSAVVFADPLDIDFYQATKALEHAAPVVAEGGSIVLVAGCRQGVGDGEFQRYLEMGREELLEHVRGGRAGNIVPAIVALKLKEIAEAYNVTLLTRAEVSIPQVSLTRDPLTALSRLKGRVLVLARGGFTVPRLRHGE
ncbi:MAG: lactate racemase domain-containing protein, partial [Thermofilaceae archaeon]